MSFISSYIFKDVRSLILLLLIFLIPPEVSSQFFTKDNITGLWQDTASWVNAQMPVKNNIDTTINCYGEITALKCIDINHSTLNVFDTLIINGNFTLHNKSRLETYEGSVFIVFGDFLIKNIVDVINNGSMIITGEFTIIGSESKGSFKNNGEVFIFDDSPDIPESDNFSDLNCSTNAGDTICGYGNEQLLLNDDLYPYYVSIPSSEGGFASSSGLCYQLNFYTNENAACLNENITFYLTTIGVDPVSDIIWNFGIDAVPSTAKGYGPQSVKYLSAGEKTITILDLSNNKSKSKTIIVTEKAEVPVISKLNTPNALYEEYLDEVCVNEYAQYTTNGSDTGIFQWVIPALNIDTITNNVMKVRWNTAPGEHLVFAREVFIPDCSPDFGEGMVLVNKCEEEDLRAKTTYAFTPNNDGINDTWVIPGIENYPLAEIFVYDKLGNLVYHSHSNYQNDWDGSVNGHILPLDSYFFVIDFSKYNLKVVTGIVTILK